MSGMLVLCFTYTYMYEIETSFTDMSGSNGLILIKFTHLNQQIIQSLHIDFQGILIIFAKPFNIKF